MSYHGNGAGVLTWAGVMSLDGGASDRFGLSSAIEEIAPRLDPKARLMFKIWSDYTKEQPMDFEGITKALNEAAGPYGWTFHSSSRDDPDDLYIIEDDSMSIHHMMDDGMWKAPIDRYSYWVTGKRIPESDKPK